MCLKVALLAVVLTSAVHHTDGYDDDKMMERIYGSAAVFGQDFTWLVGISNSEMFLCGGSVINKRTVLTSAECIHDEKAKQLKVRVGSLYKSHGGEVISVMESTYPADYEENKWRSNIAILRLAWHIDDRLNVQPVPLAAEGQYTEKGTRGEVCGWGETIHGLPEYLHCAHVEIWEHETCRTWYTEVVLNRNTLCAGFVAHEGSQCYGDSGGPLIVNRTLVGINSWGWLDQCTRNSEPGIHVKVSAFIDWINNYLRRFG